MDKHWESLIDQVYLAAHDDAVWQTFVQDAGRLFGSTVAGLELAASKNPLNRNTAAQINFDLNALEKYFEEFNSPHNNIGIRAVLAATPGKAFRISDFMSAEQFKTDPSTRAILHAQAINRGLMVSLCRPGTDFAWFNLYRNSHDGEDDYTQDDVARFTTLGDHMLRSARLRDRLNFSTDRPSSAHADHFLGDHYSDGLISVSQSGHIITLDDNAERILDADLGLRVFQGKLKSCTKNGNSDPEAFQAFLNARNAGASHPYVVPVRHGLVLVVHRYLVPYSISFAHQSATCILRIAVVNLGAEVNAHVMAGLFGLTPAETTVVSALTHTPSASEAARQLGVSRETVKTHLRSIYGKTGVSSLIQLTLLIGKLANR